MKKYVIAGTVALLALGVGLTAKAFAGETEINVLRGGKPGAGVAQWTDAITSTLKDNKIKVNELGFNSCQDAARWIKNNPGKPYITAVYSDNLILNMAEPNNPAGCNIPVTPDNLVSIMGKWYHFICGPAGKDTIEYLQSNKPKKIGSANLPVQVKVIEQQMTDIGAKNFKVISYASGKAQIQALVSGDTDYTVFSSENLIPQMEGTNCFATSAPTEIAVTFDRISYESINPNVSFNHSGLWPVILSGNTDLSKIRPLFAPYALKNQQLNTLMSLLIPVEDSIEDQINDLQQRANGLK